MIESINWLGYGGFRIQGPPLLYINPVRVVRGSFHPDAVLLGNHFHEQFSLADIQKLRGSSTRIIGNALVAQEMPEIETVVLRPWQTATIERAGIKAVPAYADEHSPYPQTDNGLGFVISLNYYDIYYAGSTALNADIEKIHPDIAILSIDGRNSTLSVDDAVQLTNQMRPRWVIPYTYTGDANPESQLAIRLFTDRVKSFTEVVALTPMR